MADTTHTKAQEEKPLEKYTIKELREIAATLPHERAIHDMKKEELVAFIKETRGSKEAVRPEKKKPAVRSRMTRPELKSRIRELKVLKREARESNDDRKAAALRHRISQLKKKTRRLTAL